MLSRIRIIAHFMHPAERDAALETCDDAEVQGNIVVGLIDEADIAGLERKGVIVQRIEERPIASGGNPISLALPSLRFRRAAGQPPFPAIRRQRAPEMVDVYVLQLAGPLLAAWSEQLAALGVEVLGGCIEIDHGQ